VALQIKKNWPKNGFQKRGIGNEGNPSIKDTKPIISFFLFLPKIAKLLEKLSSI
jgi:hypothetical protein